MPRLPGRRPKFILLISCFACLFFLFRSPGNNTNLNLTSYKDPDPTLPPPRILLVSAFYRSSHSKHSNNAYTSWLDRFLGQISTDIYFFTSPDLESLVLSSRPASFPGRYIQEEALQWNSDIKAYAALNKDQVKGFPADNIQVYELYNTPAQISARTHPNAIATQRFLLSLRHKSDTSSLVDLSNPVSRLVHMLRGSVEHWEDPSFRACFTKILQGGSAWREHDPYDVSPRVNAKHDLYNVSNKCSIFRAWQGWTSMSNTGPNEGTLKVFPNILLGTSYLILRPFFRPRNPQSSSLKFEDWTVNIDTPDFPGSILGNTQEFNEKTHPHMGFDRTMVSAPRVEPGSVRHCDVIQAVEGQHRRTSDSSVLNIPAVPLTVDNAHFMRQQRENFEAGLPPPDFPGGKGESECVGRAKGEDVKRTEARRVLGLDPFVSASLGENAKMIKLANEALRFN
ncbi:Protein of unknown function (DUF1479) domain containing protein [Amanita muscaria]